MPAPLVTCIVTAYNYGRFIARALDSILAQDYPREALEVIVVDDGSTDGTAEVVAGYGDRVRYVHQKNAGVVAATNRGLAEASGQLIAFLNADDEWRPSAVRRRVDVLAAQPEVGLVYCDTELIDSEGAVLSPSFVERYVYPNFHPESGRPLRGDIRGLLMRHNFITGGTMMFRTSLRDAYYPLPALAPFEDWYIAARLAAVAEVEFVDAPLLRHRHHGDNLVLFQEGGERLVERLRRDVRFRRWLLQTLEPGSVSARDLVGAWAGLQHDMTLLAGEAESILDSIPVSDEDRRRAAEELAAATAVRDDVAALCQSARALGLDPHDQRIRSSLAAALRRALAGEPNSDAARSELERLASLEAPRG